MVPGLKIKHPLEVLTMEKSLNDKGLNEQKPLGQKKPRGETAKGQLPKSKKETVRTDRGTFKLC